MAQITEQTKNNVAAAFFDSGLLKFGEFTLKSGITSPFYIDLRKAQSFPGTFHIITEVYAEMLEGLEPGVFLAGVPEAATPLAAAVGYELKRPLLQPRKVVKEHGTKSSVEGEFKTGDRVVLLDDLITKGDSKLEAIRQVQDAGLEVVKLVVLVDRQQGGVKMVREAGHSIEAALTIAELMDSLLDQGKITTNQHGEVLEFVKNN